MSGARCRTASGARSCPPRYQGNDNEEAAIGSAHGAVYGRLRELWGGLFSSAPEYAPASGKRTSDSRCPACEACGPKGHRAPQCVPWSSLWPPGRPWCTAGCSTGLCCTTISPRRTLGTSRRQRSPRRRPWWSQCARGAIGSPGRSLGYWGLSRLSYG
jgi:hypothetical protein